MIVLGNLTTSKACEYLYLQYYMYADLHYPGTGGYALRPLIAPLGTGAGPYREMKPAGAYLKTGDIEQVKAYREQVLSEWLKHTDESIADRSNTLHLIYHSMTMSWDLMEASGVFTDDERLKLTNQLLKVMRSNQACGYAGLTNTRYTRGNHDVRNARSFYFGYRYFNKYYADRLKPDVVQWRHKLRGFLGLCLSSSRSSDESLSQHAFGGSLNCLVDMAFMEPEWAGDFFSSGRADPGHRGVWGPAAGARYVRH